MNNPHTDSIIAAYALTFVVVVAIIVALIVDYRAQRRALAQLERPATGTPNHDAA